MASELSSFIEKELKSKGYDYRDEDDVENPHQSLMGALRVEVGARAGPPAGARRWRD
jgi:hypothetical protein